MFFGFRVSAFWGLGSRAVFVKVLGMFGVSSLGFRDQVNFFGVEGLGFGFGGFEHLGFGGVGATDALNPLKPPAPTQKKARVALNAKP